MACSPVATAEQAQIIRDTAGAEFMFALGGQARTDATYSLPTWVSAHPMSIA